MHASSWLLIGSAAAESPPAGGAEPPGKPEPRIKPGLLHLDVSDLYLGFESTYDWRRVRSSASGKRDTTHKNDDLRLQETIGLGLDGDIVDPNLIEWRAGLEFGLTQNWFRENRAGFSRDERDTGLLMEYDLSVEALRTKPFSLSAYARRTDDRVPRRFLPSLRERQTETGVSGQLRLGPLTTELGFSWRDVTRHGNRLDEDDEDLRTSRFYIDNKLEFSDRHRLRLTYDHERDESEYQGSTWSFDTRRDEVRMEHELGFGPGARHKLDTFLRYNEEQGDLARDELEIVPRLSLEHTDTFKTVYRYGFYRIEQDAIEVNQHKLDAEALYRPTDRLRLSLNGFGLHEQLDGDVETYELGTGFDVAYRRPTSLGELSINLAFAYDQACTQGDAGYRVVRREAHQLDDVRPVFLRERHVDPISIVARSADGRRVYIHGVDYVATKVGGRTQVRRLPLGRIAEDDLVYFDYRYRVPAEATVESYRGDLLIEHAFTFGLTPYYALESRSEFVHESLGTPRDRDNTDRHRLGLRYEQPRWMVGLEGEIFDDAVEPYDAFHLTGRASLFRSRAHTLEGSVELSRYFFEGGLDRRRVWWLDVDVRDRMQLSPYLWLTAGAGYRWEDDERGGTTNGVDLECGLRYVRGHLAVELTTEYDLLSIGDNREDGFGLWLRVKRDLSHLLTASRRAR